MSLKLNEADTAAPAIVPSEGLLAQWRRRMLVRWEIYPRNFLSFVQLASIGILLRHFKVLR